MSKQVRVPRVGVVAFLLILGLAGTWHTASVQVPIIITLPTVGETTLFSDNFDSYPVGSFPSAGGWEVVWGGTGQNFVVADPSVSKPHSFQLWGRPNWSSVIQRRFSTTAPVIGYEFSIRIERIGTGTPGREESPGFFNRATATWGGYYARVFFDHDTRRIEGEGRFPLGEWQPGVWYHVKVVLDRRSNLYSVWIDGRLAGQNIKTAGDTYQINALALFSGHPGVKVWYDDVRVFTQKAAAEVTLSGLVQVYTGSPLLPTATTVPAGLPIVWTNAPQVNAGVCAVTATVNDPNYEGSASGTFVINKKPATVTLTNLVQRYTGSPLSPTATTVPEGLPTVWTNVPQTRVGGYNVTATVDDPNHEGSAWGLFVITASFVGPLPPWDAREAIKPGAAALLKWQYADYFGKPIDSAGAAPKLTVYGPRDSLPEDLSGLTPVLVAEPGKDGLRYDATGFTWQYNWQTKGLGEGTYWIVIRANLGWLSGGPFKVSLRK